MNKCEICNVEFVRGDIVIWHWGDLIHICVDCAKLDILKNKK